LSNALKFTRQGGTITIKGMMGADGNAVVEVGDTGVGMSGEEISVALTPFGQVDSSHTRWREGTGLGLPSARALVQLHGGDFLIHSRKGHGTQVTVVLPAHHNLPVTEVHEENMGHSPEGEELPT
jgi:two-component system cell cycle sensor histidine kinase PleC